MRQRKRLRKLVPGSFHARLVGRFVGIAAFALALQLLCFSAFLFDAVGRIEAEDGPLHAALPEVLAKASVLSLAVLVPLCFGLATLLTFPIAGPLRRIESWLAATARGDADGPCRIRATDDFQPLCEAVNAAVERVRSDAADAEDPVGHPAGRAPARDGVRSVG